MESDRGYTMTGSLRLTLFGQAPHHRIGIPVAVRKHFDFERFDRVLWIVVHSWGKATEISL